VVAVLLIRHGRRSPLAGELAHLVRRSFIYAHQDQVDTATASRLNREQVELLHTMGQTDSLAPCLHGLAWLLMIDGQLDEAAAAISEALALDAEDSETLNTAGAIALHQDALDKADQLFLDALGHGRPRTARCRAGRPRRPRPGRRAARRTRGRHPGLRRHRTPPRTAGLRGRPSWVRLIAAATAAAAAALPAGPRHGRSARAPPGTLDETIGYVRSGSAAPTAGPAAVLTARESQAVDLLVAGHTVAQIAARLQISARTVDKHLSTIRTKLDLPNTLAVVAWATSRNAVSS
jgi:DNA-binding CsgD family transcriptional regulator